MRRCLDCERLVDGRWDEHYRRRRDRRCARWRSDSTLPWVPSEERRRAARGLQSCRASVLGAGVGVVANMTSKEGC